MSSEVPKNKGWTSFDDSPVHVQTSGTNNLASKPSPWGDDGWAKFHQQEPEKPALNKHDMTNAYATMPSAVLEHSTSVEASQHNYKQPAISIHGGTSKTSGKMSASSSLPIPLSTPASSAPHHELGHQKASDKLEKDLGEDGLNSSKTASEYQDPWCITSEQRQYYMKQFMSMQPDIEGKIDGQTARNFFTKSKLPILELSHVWELSDMDQDGHLTLEEFCTAFHLVVARKNGYELPPQLPTALVPVLIDVHLEGGSSKQKSKDQWETFSDRTSSSTTLANFDQVLDSTQEHLHRPSPRRMSPTQLQHHWMATRDQCTEEESTTSTPPTHIKNTNPYGYLKNEFSEADSSNDEEGKNHSSSDQSSLDERRFHHVKVPSDSSLSSSPSSSVPTSDRSIDHPDHKDNSFEHHNSDWSSRLLRPRSTSSEDTVPITNTAAHAPTPPPRPQPHVVKPVASPLPKPRTSVTKPPVKDTSSASDHSSQQDQPPTTKKEDVMESFADFTSLNAQINNTEENKTVEPPKEEPKTEAKPENETHKKAPTKPPRTRMMSAEIINKPEPVSLQTPDLDSPAVASPPHQDLLRSKTSIQASIRELKSRNTNLSRMNSDLQQQLKSVMETRIGVEMNIHRMRPFFQ